MSLNMSFQPRQVQIQKPVMAPRMILSMEILQLPQMGLVEKIEQELEKNPVLEVQESDPDSPEEQPDRVDSDAPTLDEKELVVDDKTKEDDFDRLMNLSEEWDEHFSADRRVSANRVDEEADRKHDAMANAVSRPQTLYDYLVEQLAMFDLDPMTRQMAERIIYNLDNNGFLPGSLEELLGPSATEEDHQLAQRALAVIHRLDPPGVGARSLRECLLLQITPERPYHEELTRIVAEHLDDLRENRLPQIQRKTGYSLETIQKALEQMRALTFRPAAQFIYEPQQVVTPDIFVRKDDNGRYVVQVEEAQIPTLYISPYYRQMLKAEETNPEIQKYIRDNISSAQWLIESIEQRRSTLTRVAQAIIDHQTKFLDYGPEHIEPLKMQQIADQVGVHVTTVSRAVDKKYVETPRGVFLLKDFFGGGTKSASGEEIAWDAVRLKLQEIIDKEDKASPLSDDELVQELAKAGLTVARRTVTKYRKAMNIPSSRQRKDWALHAKTKGSKKATPTHVVSPEPAAELEAGSVASGSLFQNGHTGNGHSGNGHLSHGH